MIELVLKLEDGTSITGYTLIGKMEVLSSFLFLWWEGFFDFGLHNLEKFDLVWMEGSLGKKLKVGEGLVVHEVALLDDVIDDVDEGAIGVVPSLHFVRSRGEKNAHELIDETGLRVVDNDQEVIFGLVR